MNRFMLGVVCGAVATTVVADEPKTNGKKAAVEKAVEAFAGGWEIVGVTPDGATQDARRLAFKKDGTYAALDKDGKELWAGTFDIDPTASPNVWDHRSHDAKKTGTDVLGIYELDGDKLEVACVVGQWKGKEWTGKPRPTAIDAKTADVIIELRRVK
jgi:uncharacterized protein (TIGR03067 family)